MGVCLALGGFFDEATQPFFGRAADALDWVFDITGIVTGIALVVIAMHGLRATFARKGNDSS
jgi:VanZ family protein